MGKKSFIVLSAKIKSNSFDFVKVADAMDHGRVSGAVWRGKIGKSEGALD